MLLPCFLLNVTGPQVTCFDTFQTHAEFRFSPDFSKRYSFIVLAATSLSNQKMQEVPYTACFNSSMHDCNNIAHASQGSGVCNHSYKKIRYMLSYIEKIWIGYFRKMDCYLGGSDNIPSKFEFIPTWDEVLNTKITCWSIFFDLPMSKQALRSWNFLFLI